MPGVLTVSEFYYENGVRLHALVTWDPANPGQSAQADMMGEYSPGVSWAQHNDGVAFLHVIRSGPSLRFETWGCDPGGDYTAANIDIFTQPIDITGPFPAALWNTQVPSPHGLWAYHFSPVPGQPNGFYLDAGRPGVLTVSEFYYENGVKLHALVTWDPANPGQSAQADMMGEYSPGVSWAQHNDGVAFLHVIRSGPSLRFETWGCDPGGDYTAVNIDIFTQPIDITGPFPAALWNTQVPSPHGLWAYHFSPVPGQPNGFYLDAAQSVSLPPSNARVNISVE